MISLFAEKIELQESEYFSFAESLDTPEGPVGKHLSNSLVVFSAQYIHHLIDRWLDHDATLEEQAVTPTTRLCFKIKYWNHPKEIGDPIAKELFYHQVSKQFLVYKLMSAIDTAEYSEWHFHMLRITIYALSGISSAV